MDVLLFLTKELKNVVFSVLPLVLILVILKLAVFRSPFESNKQFVLGTVFTILGLFLFLQGAQMSLIPTAESTGAELVRLNRPLIIVVAFCIGFVATLVEPALASVTAEAENVSVGVITSKFLLIVTAFGFAAGMALGVTKIIYNISLIHILVPTLLVLAVLGWFSSQTMGGIAFDCAAATTGPVNIPVNMALALGLARGVEGIDPLTAGFGVVGLTVLFAAISIMGFGIIRGI
jgi:hypothetical protein